MQMLDKDPRVIQLRRQAKANYRERTSPAYKHLPLEERLRLFNEANEIDARLDQLFGVEAPEEIE